MIQGNGSRQQQILQLLLENKQGLCIDELASRLAISRNAIKQHLTFLERDLLIKIQGQNTTKGRPSRNYVLTDMGLNQFPKQYSWFSNLVLQELKAEMGPKAFENFIENLGVKLGQKLKQQASGQDATSELLTMMQALGYQAEPHLNGLRAHNCVYHDLVMQHPELCMFDRALIATYLEKTIEQTDCMQLGDCACIFQLKLTEP